MLSTLQIDAVDKPSWQAQVKGHKIWTLTPPPECYFECGPRMEVTLHPGSIGKAAYKQAHICSDYTSRFGNPSTHHHT